VLLIAGIVSAFEQRPVALTGDELGTGLLLDLGKAAGVIEMRMAVQDVLDIGDLESKLGDAVLDHAGRLRERRVDEDQALRGLDDVDRDPVGTDIIDVADQLERLEWRGPFLGDRRQEVLDGLRLRTGSSQSQRTQRGCKPLHDCLPQKFLWPGSNTSRTWSSKPSQVMLPRLSAEAESFVSSGGITVTPVRTSLPD